MPQPLAVTRIAHSSHLIEISGATLLTDPWLSEKPAYYPGEPRALTVEELPALDGILISHAHYDHCDLDALDAYPDKDVPILAPASVAPLAEAHGFRRVTVLAAGDATTLGPLTVTAMPAKHQVAEITFMIQGDGYTIYFAGDTMLIPELERIPEQFPAIDLALLPINGLRIRPLLNKKIVMDAEDAATLVALLKPRLTVPHHYAFTSGPIGDRLLLKTRRDPGEFVAAVARRSPDSSVRVAAPGERVELSRVAPSTPR